MQMWDKTRIASDSLWGASDPTTLIDLLRRRALYQADRLAYTFLQDDETEERVWTYGELDSRARAIGAMLQMMSAQNERALLLYPPGLDYIAAFWGCIYATAIAVPVYPPRLNRHSLRLQAIADDSLAVVVLTTSDILARLNSTLPANSNTKKLKWLKTDDLAPGMEQEWKEPSIGPDDLALLQYTSGSTSVPKGVMLSHRNLLHNSALLRRAFEYTAESHVVSWLPMYHDMGLIGGILQPLYGGFPGTLMSPILFLQRPARWLQAISHYRATISGAPNFAYDLCVRRITAEQRATLDLSSWSVAFNGSEQVREETMRRFAEAFEPCGFRQDSFFPCYGLAEATLLVSGGPRGQLPVVKSFRAGKLRNNRIVEAFPNEEGAQSLVGCGSPPLDQKIVIADPTSLTACRSGRVGEIWVSGESIANGYWNKAQQSDATFRAHLADTGDGPFLRTGDLGFLHEGELYITGRLKDLIILRGINHYPQDIELTVERSHPVLRPGCGAAFSIDLANEERLVVVQEINSRYSVDHHQVIENIRRSIAETHGIAAYAISLIKPGAIPKTSSGKLQRYVCRTEFLQGTLGVLTEWREAVTPQEDFASSSTIAEGARTIQDWLISQFAAKLGVERVKIDVNKPIIEYGLDSLHAIELAHLAETSFGVGIPVASFLESPSIAELAAKARLELIESAGAKTLLALQPITDSALSRGQKALWFLHRLNPDEPAYNLAAAVKIRGDIDLPSLRRVFETLVDRHSMLRSAFAVSQGQPVRRIHDRGEIFFKVEDASTLTEQTLHQRLAEQANRPFDLERDPLLRVSLFGRSPQEHILLLAVHHIVADFWSLAVLMHEMGQLYTAEKRGLQAALAPLALQYYEYINWQEQMLTGPQGDKLWRFWEEQLQGELPPLNFPTDRARPPVQTYKGASHYFSVPSELIGKLKALSQARHTTLYMTMLAAFQVLLHRHTGQEDILVGTLTAGRSRAEFAGLVGYFVNPVIMRGDLSGSPTIEDCLERTRQNVIVAIEHQDYPFALLVERLQPERDPSRSPLFQVMFILQKTSLLNEEGIGAFTLGESGARFQLGELDLESMAVDQKLAQFDLTLAMAETNGGIGASFQYNTCLFDQATIRRISERFYRLLEGVVADPTQRISAMPLLTEAEEHELVSARNNTAADYPQDRCIHHLFESQVERTPEAIAVTFHEQQLSFSELNDRANQLAHYLCGLGVGPELPVGICLDRSLDLMVGLLGTLKAGGAYLPLDPALPKERLAYMIEDARVSVVLTRERLIEKLPPHSAMAICLDSGWAEIAVERESNPQSGVLTDDLCYIIYTSGSTGRPKGVMINHRNVVNFFIGMDGRIGCDEQDVFLAVTSISFDISVLELLWTISRGSKVVLLDGQDVGMLSARPKNLKRHNGIQFSLFYFASDDTGAGADRYRLLLEGAKFADRHGFQAVWTPERHFHAFGGLYPNPSVTSAALATITERIKIRGGSVVIPLHHPIRVAEEWALVDNLSNGRVGIAFASGWHADDFVFFPENYANRKEAMIWGIETVKKLWRGESLRVRGGTDNELEIKIYPQPRQPELPIWITAAGAPDTFVLAGKLGAHVLTHLLGQSVEEVKDKIALYRETLASHGHDPRAGQVTLMLHTFIGEGRAAVKEKVRAPLIKYLRSSIGLTANLIKSLNMSLDLKMMSEKDMDDLLSYAFDRYFETSGLFGTPRTCQAMIEQLKDIGVNEVACLIDFGVDANSVLASLNHLNSLRELSNKTEQEDDYSLRAETRRRSASQMQCTPSMMRMLSLDSEALEDLGSLRTLMLGGEALSPGLAKQIKKTLPGRLMNMYGPTETTVWSSTLEVDEVDSTVSIGRPIANTQIYILDRHLQLMPTGAPGELYIGGTGLARGYRGLPGLSAEKFIPHPLSNVPGARLYKTGDLARHLPDGAVEFLGRLDHQIKIRGYRVELEEIEAVLTEHSAVRESVVLAREDTPGDKRLVAYIVLNGDLAPGDNDLRNYLKGRFPDYMVPSAFVSVEVLPLTPNGKVDRRALPAPEKAHSGMKTAYASPRNNLEQSITAVWQRVLRVGRVGIHDNFFDLGGHSLLMAQVHSELRQSFNKDFPLVKILEHPTISSLAKYLAEEESEQVSVQQSYERAMKQREGLKRQRESLKTSGRRR
jgi:natural product biosynthesis luciferase-like monooxygenase protein